MPHLPPTAALRAFEAAARHLNVTRAAEEIGLTHGAVSHQIRELEARLGVRLFEREPRGLSLTAAGDTYRRFVEEALAQLRDGAAAVARHGRGRVLTVSVSPNFAHKWLVPRLGRFLEAHPDIDLRLSASMRHVDFRGGDIDVAVRHGDGNWPALDVTKLCDERIFPVCSPALGASIRGIAGLTGHTLLHDRDPVAWRDWLARFGVVAPEPPRGPVFDQASLAIDAAVSGQGIALARSALVALDLAAGRLVRPVAEATDAPFAYWIVCPPQTARTPSIARFRAWLLEQATPTSGAARPD